MQNIKTAIVQSNIYWNDIQKNLTHFSEQIGKISSDTDLIVLPEMFTTGFNMKPKDIFEEGSSATLEWMKKTAQIRQCIIAGSLLFKENEQFFNRLFWVGPHSNYDTYDKKHLFSFVGEDKIFTPGKKHTIVSYKGMRFLLIICYDLRFPVWCKNKFKDGSYDYDAIVCVANWPEVRGHVWRLLLQARAVENQAYVIGVNRVGKDINGINHSGDSMIICPKGEIIAAVPPNETAFREALLEMQELKRFREKFFAAADWDDFKIL